MRGFVVLLALPMLLAGCFDQLVHGADPQPRDYVSDSTYKSWVIEVDHSSGSTPDGALLDFVKARMASVVKKESIEFRLDESIGTDSNKAWGDSEVQSFASSHAGLKTEGTQVVTHLVFLNGHSAHDTDKARVLGITFDHFLVVIFSDSVKSSCDPGVLPLLATCRASDYFNSVVTHEFGHVLGLVDNGAPMQQNHLDPDTSHGKHSSNNKSVMYWAVESTAGLPLFGGNAPPSDFDDQDKADLRALQ